MKKIDELEPSGGGGAVIITDTNNTLDKTYAEIYDLIHSGTPCYIRYWYGESIDLDEEYSYGTQLMPVVSVYKYNEDYRIYASISKSGVSDSGNYNIGSPATCTYQASSSTDYPTFLRTTYVSSDNLLKTTSRL